MSLPMYHTFSARFEDLRSQIDRWSPENPLEAEQVAKWKDQSRRESWIAGRLLLKASLLAVWEDEFSQFLPQPPSTELIEIVTRNSEDKGIRPQIKVKGQPLPASISLSHSETQVVGVLTSSIDWSIGIDLTSLKQFDPAKLNWCWSSNERELIENSNEPQQEAARIWTLKEAGYKACNFHDEGFNPQQVLVSRSNGGEYQLQYLGIQIPEESEFHIVTTNDEITGIVLVHCTTEFLDQLQTAVRNSTMQSASEEQNTINQTN